MKPVIIFGTGHFAEVAHFYLTNDSEFDVAYFTANKEQIVKEKLLDLDIVPFEDIEIKYPPEKYDMFIAIAYSKINKVRAEIFQQAKTKGYNLITSVNSKVTKWGELDIAKNCFILENISSDNLDVWFSATELRFKIPHTSYPLLNSNSAR